MYLWLSDRIEGSLEVKLPTIWTDEKQSRAEAERRERVEERRSEKRKSQKKEDADARKGRKVAKHCVFPMIWGSGGWKSRLAKAAGAEPAGQMRDEKVHAVVARSTFASQNVENTPFSDHFWKLRCWKSACCCGAKHIWKLRCRKSARRFGAKHISKWTCTKHTMLRPLLEVEMSKQCTPLWREAHWKLRCRKSARRCGAKHISKWKCTKHTMLRPLLEVEMSKQCTPLWREAQFEVKMYKAHHVRTAFGSWDVEKVHAVVARSTFPSQNVQNTPCTDHFWRFRSRFAWQAQGTVDLVKSEQNVRVL